MAAIYWDTSALLKLYAPEADSSNYRQLLLTQPEEIAISFLHCVEMFYALRAKEWREELSPGHAKHLFQSFEEHVKQQRYRVLSWSSDVASESRQLMEQCITASPAVALRSLDGLHLGTTHAVKISGIVTADIRMRQAAAIASIVVIDP